MEAATEACAATQSLFPRARHAAGILPCPISTKFWLSNGISNGPSLAECGHLTAQLIRPALILSYPQLQGKVRGCTAPSGFG
jgi:hypothetical protein